MAGIMDSLIKGYTNRVLGPDQNEAARNTATAYANLQDAMNTQYNEQKVAFETDPANKGKSWSAPTPIERAQDEISAMILSGDPTLQSRGLQMYGSIQPTSDSSTAAIKEYQYAVSHGYKGTFKDWKEAQKGGTTVNVNSSNVDKPVTISDLSKLTMPDGSPVPPGTTYGQLRDMGATLAQTQPQAKSGTSADIIGTNLQLLRDSIDADSSPIRGAGTVLRTAPGVMGSMVNAAMTASGYPMNDKAVDFNTSVRTITGHVTNLMNGAGASEGERDYWASLQPQFTDDLNTRKRKFNNILEFGQFMAERAKSAGVKDVPDFKATPFEISDSNNLPELPSGYKWDD